MKNVLSYDKLLKMGEANLQGGAIMQEKTYDTSCGTIHYWVSKIFDDDSETLVFSCPD
jgi:hypothetical protein